MKHILYLPGWFPNRKDSFSGDFILRHAQAASLYNRITVFFTAPDKDLKKPEIIAQAINENFLTVIYYYPAGNRLLKTAFNGIRRFNALRKMYQVHFGKKPPDLAHVHVAWPAGLFALYLKKRRGLKYVLTEHETIYMPGHDNYRIQSAFEKKMLPVIFRQAAKVHTVSHSLGEALIKLKLLKQMPEIIPNVVDTHLFSFHEKPVGNSFRFIHVSGLTRQKNPEGMLQALAEVKKLRNDFTLTIIGPANEKIKGLAKKLSLDDNIIFTGELPYEEVAKRVSQSDAMIHFTRYETFGCVVAESLCCGVPVIISNLAVTRELVRDSVNGLLVEENNVNELAEKILYFMNRNLKINPRQVAEDSRKKFNYERVGKLLDEFYNKSLSL
jgi:glycosyltransferase involved in cell wall biosynthesis